MKDSLLVLSRTPSVSFQPGQTSLTARLSQVEFILNVVCFKLLFSIVENNLPDWCLLSLEHSLLPPALFIYRLCILSRRK